MKKQIEKCTCEMLTAEEMKILFEEGGCPWPNMKAPKHPSQVSSIDTDEVKHRAIV